MKSQNENVNVRTNGSLSADAGPVAAERVMGANERTKRLTTIAMLSAVAYVLMFLSHVIPAVEGFLRYDPADIVTVIGGFMFGPMTALLISAVVSFVESVTISSTGAVGLIMNVLSTCSFACVAAFIYKKKQTLAGAVLALAAGIAAMTAMMLLWNYIITPLYMAVPRARVAAMLLTVFMPFNLLKGALNATVTLLVYKPLVTALRRARLISATRRGGGTGDAPAEAARAVKRAPGKGVMIASAIVLITCVMLLLAWAGVI